MQKKEFLGNSLLADWQYKGEKSYHRRKDNSQKGCGKCGPYLRLYWGLKGWLKELSSSPSLRKQIYLQFQEQWDKVNRGTAGEAKAGSKWPRARLRRHTRCGCECFGVRFQPKLGSVLHQLSKESKSREAKSFPAREEPVGVQALRKHCGPFCQPGRCEKISVHSSVVRVRYTD